MRTPNDGKKYWYIFIGWVINIDSAQAIGNEVHKRDFKTGNFFNTKKEAQEALKKIQELLLSLKK